LADKKGLFEKTGLFLWEIFASLRLTIVLFSLIVVASILGTLLPDQMGFMAFLKGKPEFIVRLVFFFGIQDLFYSWWFNLLILLLGINIICCSLERLPNVFKIIFKRPNPPSSSMKKKIKDSLEIRSDFSSLNVVEKTEAFFQSKGMKIYKQENSSSFLAEKGRWTRIGVYIVHLGFLLLIAGVAMGRFFGFSGVIDIPEGEERGIVQLYKGKGSVKLPFKVACNSFRMETYKNGMPSLYESELVFKDEKQKSKHIIKVNSPYSYKGMKFVQSGYGKVLDGKVKFGVYSSADDELIDQFELSEKEGADLPGEKRFLFFAFRPNFHISSFNLGDTLLGIIIKGKTQRPVAIPVHKKGFDKHRGDKFYISPITLNTKFYTSVQVNKDPGVYIVYTGFLLILFGCFASFFIFHEKVFVFVEELPSGGSSLSIFCTINRRMELAKEKNRKNMDKLNNIFQGRGDR